MLERRCSLAQRLTTALKSVPEVVTPRVVEGSRHVYWRYPIFVDPAVIHGGPDALAVRLLECGLPCAPRYTRKLAFECQVFREQRTFGNSSFPFVGPHMGGNTAIVFDRSMTPAAAKALDSVIVLPLNERMTEEDIDWMAQTVKSCVQDALSA